MKTTMICTFCTIVLSLTIAVAAPRGGNTAGIAYDEVTKILDVNETTEPGSFDSDFSSAVAASKAASQPGTHHGLFGSIMNAMDAARGAMNMMKTGFASSNALYGGMERIDDLGAQTATIEKPQQHQIIALNLAKKTYRIVDTSAGPSVAPDAMQRSQTAMQGGRPPQPGTGKLDVRVSTMSLGSRIISNVPTTGYKISFSLTETQSTGSCRDGSFSTLVTEYVSNYAEPGLAGSSPRAQSRPMAHPELMALTPGCRPTITTHSSMGAQAQSNRLVMWMLVTVGGNAPSAQGQMRGGFSTLMERGNVRTLSAADKSMFQIPPDFTQETASPSP